jgi:hypothetical protein
MKYFSIWVFFGCALQVYHHLEWYCRDYGKEIGGLKKAVFIKGVQVSVD